MTINILRERYNPTFSAITFTGVIARNTAPVSSVYVFLVLKCVTFKMLQFLIDALLFVVNSFNV